jgi:hypothetical protein
MKREMAALRSALAMLGRGSSGSSAAAYRDGDNVEVRRHPILGAYQFS